MKAIILDPAALPRTPEGLLIRSELLAFGIPAKVIDRHIATGRWRRLQRAVYLPAGADLTARVAAHAALYAVNREAVVSHHTAARLHGIPLVSEPDTEHITIPFDSRRPHRGLLTVHCHDLEPEEVCQLDGVPATSPMRTCFDLLFGADELTALWACEHAVRSGSVKLPYLRDRVDAASKAPSIRRARQRVELVEPRSESPLETAARLVFIRAKLPAPCVQEPILDDSGREVYRLDLSYPKYRVGIEFDGRSAHERPGALLADRWRQNYLAGRGWIVLRFTWADVMGRPGYVVSTVRTALYRDRLTA